MGKKLPRVYSRSAYLILLLTHARTTVRNRLTVDELRARYSSQVTMYDIATLDGVIFRPLSPMTRDTRTDNSGVMYPFKEEGAEEVTTAFGYIQDIFGHTIEWEGDVIDTIIVLRVRWFITVELLYDGRVPIVKDAVGNSWNDPAGDGMYINIGDIYAQSVMFMPLDGDAWDTKDDMMAIFRQAETPIDFTAEA